MLSHKSPLRFAIVFASIIAGSLLFQTAFAQESDSIEELVIWGRSLQLLGTADSASQGVVGYKGLLYPSHGARRRIG